MNTVVILDRSFLDMELLKPILCAVSLIQDEDTGKLLMISEFIKDDANRLKRNKAQVHNFNEKRSVKFMNYELATRGKNNIKAAFK